MARENSNLFVISGGPGAGKTTMLAELKELGFGCMPEAARQIIQEEVEAGGNALQSTPHIFPMAIPAKLYLCEQIR